MDKQQVKQIIIVSFQDDNKINKQNLSLCLTEENISKLTKILDKLIKIYKDGFEQFLYDKYDDVLVYSTTTKTKLSKEEIQLFEETVLYPLEKNIISYLVVETKSDLEIKLFNNKYVINNFVKFKHKYPNVDNDFLKQVCILSNLEDGDFVQFDKVSTFEEIIQPLHNQKYPQISLATAEKWILASVNNQQKQSKSKAIVDLYNNIDVEFEKKEFDKEWEFIKFYIGFEKVNLKIDELNDKHKKENNGVQSKEVKELAKIIANIIINMLGNKSQREIKERISTNKVRCLALSVWLKILTIQEVRLIVKNIFDSSDAISEKESEEPKGTREPKESQDTYDFIKKYIYPKFFDKKQNSVSDDVIDKSITEIIKNEDNQKTIEQYKSGNDKAINALVGKVIKLLPKESKPDAKLILEKIKQQL